MNEEAMKTANLIRDLIDHDLNRAMEKFAQPSCAETADLHHRIMAAARRNGCSPWLWPHNVGPFIGSLLSLGNAETSNGGWVRMDPSGTVSFKWMGP